MIWDISSDRSLEETFKNGKTLIKVKCCTIEENDGNTHNIIVQQIPLVHTCNGRTLKIPSEKKPLAKLTNQVQVLGFYTKWKKRMRFLAQYVALDSVGVSTVVSGFAWKSRRNKKFDSKNGTMEYCF